MELDYRDYEAIRYLLMCRKEKYEENLYEGDLLFLEYRLRGIIEAFKSLTHPSRYRERFNILTDSLLCAYRDLVTVLYDSDIWQKRLGISIVDQQFLYVDDVDKLLSVKELNEEFFKDFLDPVIKDLINYFKFERKMNLSTDYENKLESMGIDRKKFFRLLECMRFFKNALKMLEDYVRKSVLDEWANKPKSFRQRYLVINSAKNVSDVFRDEDTISASVVDILNPHWYQEWDRKVLFIYEVNADQVIGMFPRDSSTFYCTCESVEDALSQLLTNDGLERGRNLRCNVTGYRPAYALDDIVSKEDDVSEIVLKGSAKPVGILLVSEYQTEEAKCYAKLMKDVKVWSIEQYQEMIRAND